MTSTVGYCSTNGNDSAQLWIPPAEHTAFFPPGARDLPRRLDRRATFGHTGVMMSIGERRLVLSSLGVLGGLLLSSAAQADGMRCGSRLIANGDTSHFVRSTCGKPQAVEHRTQTETVRRRVIVPCLTGVPGVCVEEQEHTITHNIETWTYDFGSLRLVHYATFVDGSLRDVQTGGYGTGDNDE